MLVERAVSLAIETDQFCSARFHSVLEQSVVLLSSAICFSRQDWMRNFNSVLRWLQSCCCCCCWWWTSFSFIRAFYCEWGIRGSSSWSKTCRKSFFEFQKHGMMELFGSDESTQKFPTKTRHSLFSIVKYIKTDGNRFIMQKLSFCHTPLVFFFCVKYVPSKRCWYTSWSTSFSRTWNFFFKIETVIGLNAVGTISNQLWSFYINSQRHVSNSLTSVFCDKSQVFKWQKVALSCIKNFSDFLNLIIAF